MNIWRCCRHLTWGCRGENLFRSAQLCTGEVCSEAPGSLAEIAPPGARRGQLAECETRCFRR